MVETPGQSRASNGMANGRAGRMIAAGRRFAQPSASRCGPRTRNLRSLFSPVIAYESGHATAGCEGSLRFVSGAIRGKTLVTRWPLNTAKSAATPNLAGVDSRQSWTAEPAGPRTLARDCRD